MTSRDLVSLFLNASFPIFYPIVSKIGTMLMSCAEEPPSRVLVQSTTRINQAVQGIRTQHQQVQQSTSRIEGIITQGSRATHTAVEELGVAEGLLNSSAGVLNQTAARLGEASIPLQNLAERTSNAVERLGEITTLREENQRLLQDLAASRDMNRTFHAAIQRLQQQIDQQNTEIARLQQIITAKEN